MVKVQNNVDDYTISLVRCWLYCTLHIHDYFPATILHTLFEICMLTNYYSESNKSICKILDMCCVYCACLVTESYLLYLYTTQQSWTSGLRSRIRSRKLHPTSNPNHNPYSACASPFVWWSPTSSIFSNDGKTIFVVIVVRLARRNPSINHPGRLFVVRETSETGYAQKATTRK